MEEDVKENLKDSILMNGWTQPIVVHAKEYYIIDGEQRWTVAGMNEIVDNKELTPPDVDAGYVPVYGIEINDTQAKMATIQHNRARGELEEQRLEQFVDESIGQQIKSRTPFDDEVEEILDSEGEELDTSVTENITPPADSSTGNDVTLQFKFTEDEMNMLDLDDNEAEYIMDSVRQAIESGILDLSEEEREELESIGLEV
jgi:hypothetical protein